MIAQMIRPQTTIPTAQAAIQDPCHRVSTTWPCLVTGGSMPMRVNALDWQPVVASSTAAPMAARSTQRRIRSAAVETHELPSQRVIPGPARPVISASYSLSCKQYRGSPRRVCGTPAGTGPAPPRAYPPVAPGYRHNVPAPAPGAGKLAVLTSIAARLRETEPFHPSISGLEYAGGRGRMKRLAGQHTCGTRRPRHRATRKP